MESDRIAWINVSEWQTVDALKLVGVARADGYPADEGVFTVAVHRWGALRGAAVLQLSVEDWGEPFAVLFPLPPVLAEMEGKTAGVNGKDCGTLEKVRIAIRPGEQDAEALQSHIGVADSDDLFLAAGGLSWADLIGEGEQDGAGE